MSYLLLFLLLSSITCSSTEESKEILTICTNSLLSSLPPAFCWKKGGDAGTIPKNCPKGFTRKAALCEENCKPGYKFIAGLCYKNCKKGYKDHGLTCYAHFFKWHFKKSYIPKRLTNFDKRVTCPCKMYHSAALCYRDCNIIGLVNCGIGACAVDKDTCGNKVGEMVISVLTGGLSLLTKVFTMGNVPFGNLDKNLINNGLNKLGKDHIINVFKNVKNVLNLGKNYIHKQGYKKAQDLINKSKVLGKLNLNAEKVCNPIWNSLEEKVNQFGITSNDGIIDVIDILKAIEVGMECKGKDPLTCAKDVMSVFKEKDPTGLLAIAISFMHPECVVPVE